MERTRVIWKYCTAPQYLFQHMMPAGAEILHVGEQDGLVCIWAAVRPDNKPVRRWFTMYATGQPLDEPVGTFRGTFTYQNHLVFHIFERGEA